MKYTVHIVIKVNGKPRIDEWSRYNTLESVKRNLRGLANDLSGNEIIMEELSGKRFLRAFKRAQNFAKVIRQKERRNK